MGKERDDKGTECYTYSTMTQYIAAKYQSGQHERTVQAVEQLNSVFL